MKKFTVIFLIFTFTLSISSCAREEADLNDVLQRIYIIEGETLSSADMSQKIESGEILFDVPVYSQDKEAIREKTITLFSKNCSLKYNKTMYFPVADKAITLYLSDSVNGETYEVAYDKNGKICGIYGKPFAILNIESTDTIENVQKALEENVKDYIDYSKYSKVKTTGAKQGEEKFGLYTFTYYNSIDGYMTDFARICVTDNGEVSGLSICDVGVDVNSLNINKDSEDQLIKAKLENIYSSQNLEFVNYVVSAAPIVRLHNGELHIEYALGVSINDDVLGERYGEQVKFLIPLELISQ